MEEQQDSEESTEIRPSRLEPVYELLEWLAKVSVPLGAAVLAIAALYWLEFVKFFALPVDFSSTATLTGLPALAAVIAAVVGLMTIVALVPAVTLIQPIASSGRTLLHEPETESPSTSATPKWNRYLTKRWLGISALLNILWGALLLFTQQSPYIEIMRWASFAIIMLLAYALILPVYKHATNGKRATADFVFTFMMGVLAQLVLFLSVFIVALETLQDTHLSTVVIAYIACFVVSECLSALQLAAAKQIIEGWASQIPKWLVPAALITLAAPLAYPPLGSAIASYPFRVSAAQHNNHSSCVTLVAPKAMEEASWPDLRDPKKPGHTQPLAFAARLDNNYYVKLRKDPTTHILPASLVTAVEGCPKTKPESNKAKHLLPQPTHTQSENKSMTISPALLISLGSLLVAIFSVFLTLRLWRKSNRPLVTARISTHSGGNVGITLDILIENSGTRPALDVRLQAREEDIRAAMLDQDENADLPKDAKRVFFSDIVVPVLPTGRVLSNAFEALGNEGTWKPGARIPIKVLYRSMDGAKYEEPGELLLHDDDGFAQTSWKSPAERNVGHRSFALAEDERKLLERLLAQQRRSDQGKA